MLPSKPFYSVNISGGKDSLFMFSELILKNKMPFHQVVTAELEIENPIETRVKKFVEDRCNEYGIPFIRVKPNYSYQHQYDYFGKLPNSNFMWCQKYYKQYALKDVDKAVYKRGFTNVHYIGFCADEERRFYRIGLNNGTVIYPIADAGICEDYILDWARHCELFDGWYEKFDRLGCTMCPYGKADEIEWLLKKGYTVYSLDNGINFNHYGNGEKIDRR